MYHYSVEICKRTRGKKRQPSVKWIDLYQISKFNFDNKHEAFKFARSLDLYVWRVFVVSHDYENVIYGFNIVEVRR